MVFLVSEMPHGRKDHGNTMFVGRLDNLFVANTAACLDNGSHARFRSRINPVAEGKEGIRSEYGTMGRQQCFLDGDLG